MKAEGELGGKPAEALVECRFSDSGCSQEQDGGAVRYRGESSCLERAERILKLHNILVIIGWGGVLAIGDFNLFYLQYMSLNIEEVKEALKKIGNCQPMNEHQILAELELLLKFVQDFDQSGNLELLTLIAKHIIEFRQFTNHWKLANAIILQTAAIALRFKDQLKAWEALRTIFDPERQFFRYQDQVVWDDTKLSHHPMTNDQHAFCAGLKEDQLVDALKEEDKQNGNSIVDWSRGKISKLNDRYVWVRWEQDDTKRKISRYSMDIAPYKSKVSDQHWEWRLSLQPGDIVDCADTRVWQHSTVMERFEFEGIVEYLIGFRHYDDAGNQFDSLTGRKFFGWHSQYDERLRASSPRIRQKNTFAKSFCKYSSTNYSEETIHDCNDFLYPEDWCGVPRFNTKSQRRSQLMVDLIRLFGEKGGFQFIIESLESKKQFCPIDVVHCFMVILGNMHEMLHRDLCLKFVPRIWVGLQQNILNSPDGNLRNFSGQKIADILIGAGAILKRVYSLKEKQEMTDRFDMDIAFKCFSSEFLERKLQGLKAIQELIKKTKEYQITMDSSDIKFLSNEIMKEWLAEKKIFETLYVNSANSHLVQRSAEFFKFLLEEKIVTQDHIHQMWQSISKGETEHKLAIYKLFKDVSSSLDRDQMEYLMTKVCSRDPPAITKDDIELLQDLTKFNYKYKEFTQRFADFYWDILTSNKLTVQMTEYILSCFVDLITSSEMKPNRPATLQKIGRSIIQEQAMNISLRALMKFVDKQETHPSNWEQYTKNLALTEIESSFQITQHVIKSLAECKQIKNEALYLEEIKIRMQFIQFFYQNISTSEHRLTFGVISTLWELLVCQSYLQAERDLIYKWFSALSSIDGQSQLSQMVPVEDLKQFALTKMTADKTQLVNLTEEGFSCFRTVLQAIAKQDPHFSNNEGFEIVWYIILEAQNPKVSRLAVEFYQTMKPSVNFLFAQLNENRDHPQRLHRCLLVIEDFIDQSETQGVGNLKSLNALSKGEELVIPVYNEHSPHSNIPKSLHLRVNDHLTIIELRVLISKQIKASWDSIGLSSTKGEIKPTDNGKMIKDLRLKKGETLHCFQKPTDKIPELPLLDENQMLTQRAKEVFNEIFNEYSHEGKMTKEDCTRFVTGCTGNHCTVEDQNIQRTFEQYDKDKDNILTLQDFLDFYTDSARTKKQTVWLNLQTLHYRNDLVRGDRVALPQVDASKLPRGEIVQNQGWLETLFSFLESPHKDVQEEAWYLLRRLPPSPIFVKKMLTFEGVSAPQDWDTILINSNYRLLYSLYIIEFLMASQDQEALLALMQDDEEIDQIINLRDKWMSRFLQTGGFDKLLNFFKYYQGKTVDALTLIEKEILSFLLKTFQQYLVAACSVRVQGLYRASFVILDNKQLDACLTELRSHSEEPNEFVDLVQKIRENRLYESIIEKFELEKFLKVLIRLVHDLLQAVELESEERQIIEYSVVTIIVILLHSPDLLTTSIENQDFISLLFQGIFTDKSINTRNLFGRAILVICHESQRINSAPTRVILEKLIRMQGRDDEFKKNSAQYYELLCQLLDSAFEQEDSQQYIDFKALGNQILEELVNHRSQETRAKNTPVDKVLIGLLNMLSKLLRFIDKPVMDVVFSGCLYSFDPDVEIKCKSQDSRAAAFKVLTQLVKEQGNWKTLLESLHQLANRIPLINKWNYIPAQDMRSHLGYCGIRNLRCICYMNAMLQQFYMTPPFRYGILQADDKRAPDLQMSKNDFQYDDNVLHQLQQMFAYLEMSDRVEYNPQEFCAAFKDYAGEPVNIFIQQDAQEFLNMIFDTIENLVKGTAYKYILDGVYGGKTCTQITCTSCKYMSEKSERFYNLSLTIKGLKNLNECFEKLIEGENISDFHCDNCKQRVYVTKRQLLHELPNVLILHLQRIVYNLDTFMNEKINSRVEFPMQLDLKDFVVSDGVDRCTEYKLVGVVVHLGNAEVGHYFSYIDTNREGVEKSEHQWLEFNDSKIKEFKLKSMEAECFGGQSNEYCDTDVWGISSRENSQSAYMLVYEKVVKDPIQLVFNNQEELNDWRLKNQTQGEQDGLTLKLGFSELKPFIPEELRKKVNYDNQQFLLERNLFNQDLMKFIAEISDMIEGPHVQEMVEILVKFNYDLLAKAYDNKIMDQFGEKISCLIQKYPSESYLDMCFFGKMSKVVDLLLICPETSTRKQFGKLLVQFFNQTIELHNLSLLSEDLNPLNSKVVDGLDAIFLLLQDQVPKNQVRFEQYFQFWLDFLNSGQVQKAYMQRKQTAAYFIDFILDKYSPVQLYEKKNLLGTSYYAINYGLLVQIIAQLLGNNTKLSGTEKRLLYSFRFYDKLIKQGKIEDLIPLILNLSYNNQYYSEIIAGCILRGIPSHDYEELRSFLTLCRPFIQINDNYKTHRMEWLVGLPSAKQHASSKGYDPLSKQPRIELPSFGFYGISSLEDDIWSYTSPLGWQPTMMDAYLQSKPRNQECQSLLILRYLLQICCEDDDVFRYVSRLPCANYQYRSMDELFQLTIDAHSQDIKRFCSNYPKKQDIEEAKNYLEKYMQKLQAQQNEFTEQQNFIVGKSVELVKLKRTYYLYNPSTKEEISCEENSAEYHELKDQIEEGTLQKCILMEEKTFKSYVCDNQPNGMTNLALPQQYVKGTTLNSCNVDPSSPTANFILSKPWGYESQGIRTSNFSGEPQQESEIKNMRIEQSVKQISLSNQNHQKTFHVILHIKGPENAPHYVPKSKIQSIMSPRGSAIMFTAIKNQAGQEFVDLDMELTYKRQEQRAANSDGHIYLSSDQEMNLDLLHNE